MSREEKLLKELVEKYDDTLTMLMDIRSQAIDKIRKESQDVTVRKVSTSSIDAVIKKTTEDLQNLYSGEKKSYLASSSTQTKPVIKISELNAISKKIDEIVANFYSQINSIVTGALSGATPAMFRPIPLSPEAHDSNSRTVLSGDTVGSSTVRSHDDSDSDDNSDDSMKGTPPKTPR